MARKNKKRKASHKPSKFTTPAHPSTGREPIESSLALAPAQPLAQSTFESIAPSLRSLSVSQLAEQMKKSLNLIAAQAPAVPTTSQTDELLEFYLKYQHGEPVPISHYADPTGQVRVVSKVSHLIKYYQQRPGSPLANTDSADLTLHLPDGMTRADIDIDNKYFKNPDDVNDTALKVDCPLSALGAIGKTSEMALIIKKSIIIDAISMERATDLLTGQLSNERVNVDAAFSDTCLEIKLSERLTTYEFDGNDDIKVLLSVSGAGKTRQLLELLYKDYGYYFVCHSQGGKFGSKDLMECSKICLQKTNETEYYIKLLVFVRIVVCNILKDTHNFSPAQVLLAQIHPDRVFGNDIFHRLYMLLAYQTSQVNISDVYLKRGFQLAAVDEVQVSVKTPKLFILSTEFRPFFSPLFYNLKPIFKDFIMSGTGINFNYMKEMLESLVVKNDWFIYQVISTLEPLKEDDIAKYIDRVLGYHCLDAQTIKTVKQRISGNALFLGRARFIASVLDTFIETNDIDLAISHFIKSISDPCHENFPLKFYREALSSRPPSPILKKSVGNDTLHNLICDALVKFMMTGEAIIIIVDPSEQNAASDTVHYGICFCTAGASSCITSLHICESAIVECLRCLIPVNDVISRLYGQMISCPKPHMVGHLLEYLVAYAFVGQFNTDNLKFLCTSMIDIVAFLEAETDHTKVFFPDHCCGPDIIYKYENTVHFIQVRFVDTISKQQRIDACNTTDPNYFYWNKKKNKVLSGFEQHRKRVLKALKNTTYERHLFLHTNTKIETGIKNVKLIKQDKDPTFFDCINPGIWELLNKMRSEFDTVT